MHIHVYNQISNKLIILISDNYARVNPFITVISIMSVPIYIAVINRRETTAL